MGIFAPSPGSSGTPPVTGPAPTQFFKIIYGDGGYVFGSGWNEIIYGTRGVDVVIGDGGHDIIHGYGGNDRIDGGTGNDKVFAGTGDDWVWGGKGEDTIDGGSGTDLIMGGEGDDILTGGIEADKFDFDVGDGDDIVTDYQPGVDTLRFFAAYVNGPIDHTITQTSDGVLIEYGDQGDSVLLQGTLFYDPGDFGFFH